MDFRARVAAICQPLPGAIWGDEATGELPSWKVGGKMFASLGHTAPVVSVKCADVETATMLIETGVATRAPYFHKSWVRLGNDTRDDDLRHRLRSSYTIIRAALPAPIRRTLAPMEGV